jgi:sulfur-carrier protein adenylyltransferase/sulfurtransferase
MSIAVKEITVQEFAQLRKAGADFQLIDVREPHEYGIANLKGELIPLAALLDQADRISPYRQVVVHCRSGKRSAQAILQLQSFFNFDNLYNLKGGILAYADEIDPSVPKY